MNQSKSLSRQPQRHFTFAAVLLLLTLITMNGSAQLATRHSQTTKPQTKNPSTLVAVVSRAGMADGEANLDAVVIVESGKLRQPYPEEDEAGQRKFAGEYFAPGRKFRVTFGGGEVGSVTIKSFDMGCNNIHAVGAIEDAGRIPAQLAALATDSDSLGRKPSSRRAPTDAERAAMNLLVTQIYRAHGATRAVLRTVVTTNLTATDLDGDGKLELIGSYTAESKIKARKDLLLIAEPSGMKFKPAWVKFQAYKLAPEGFDSAIDFVDQLDLDGDGVAEVFVRQHGFDAYGYGIYKKSRGRWREIYTAAGDAC
jgi:hypothetical protein